MFYIYVQMSSVKSVPQEANTYQEHTGETLDRKMEVKPTILLYSMFYIYVQMSSVKSVPQEANTYQEHTGETLDRKMEVKSYRTLYIIYIPCHLCK